MDAVQLLKQLQKRINQRKLYTHLPYGHPDTLFPDGKVWKEKHEAGEWGEWSNRPWQWNFHEAGKDNQERMQLCANRIGKSISSNFECALHMTGDYPDWWPGRRFDKPVLVWTGSPTNETSRDIMQKMLIGGTTNEEFGTGFIPREKFIGKPKMRQAGVSDVVDKFQVRHVSGGVSSCILKTYEQGWRKWQGTEPDVIALDEEPEDFKIYTEALTRLLTSRGIMMVTFTPLLGQTPLVRHFESSENDGVWVGHAIWDDAPHLLKADRDRMMRSYPEWERQARIYGVPMMGEGAIFTVPEDTITVDPFPMPDHWVLIDGIDFGMNHPFGLARIAWDRDNDIIYLYDDYRATAKDFGMGSMVSNTSEKIKTGLGAPVAWPHDGEQSDPGREGGKRLKDLYADHGVNMLARSARYKNDQGSKQPVWPIIDEIKEREATGRFKIFKSCQYYLQERRGYHTKDGKIVDKHEDTLKACFYAVMMKRYARARYHIRPNIPQGPQSSIFSVRH